MNPLSDVSETSFSERLLAWYDRAGRHHLPWKQVPDAYPIWVSEIMLQQTQTTTVIPYFERFMLAFPQLADLAEAPEDEVLHHWSGLGYYARARNLHRCAKQVCEQFGGEFPMSINALQSLPGIGRSTAGAIVALASDQRAVILDGNVKRVLTRFGAVEGWPGHAAVQKKLWADADRHTPANRVADYTQAIMDLGATVCTRRSPQCVVCPLELDCQARQQDQIARFPASKPKVNKPIKRVSMLMMVNQNDEVLLEKRPNRGIWGGLWSFPECDTVLTAEHDSSLWQADIAERFDLFPIRHRTCDDFRHTFSHYHLDIHPVEIDVDCTSNEISGRWIALNGPISVGLPAPVSGLLQRLAQSRNQQKLG